MATRYKVHNPEGIYFMTLTVVQWVDIFTRPVYKDILIKNLKYCQENKGLEIYAYVIMTNHLHLLVASNSGKGLPFIIGDFKKYSSKEIYKTMLEIPESRHGWMSWIFTSAGEFNPKNKNIQIWQNDNHPIEVFSNKVIEQKLNYIHENPVRQSIVSEPHEYIYSSAKNYAGMDGMLNISLL